MEETSLVNSTVSNINFTIMPDEYVQENLRLNEAINTSLINLNTLILYTHNVYPSCTDENRRVYSYRHSSSYYIWLSY